MKEINEFKEEIFRRSDERKTKKKIMHRKTAALCLVLALCISLGTFAAFRLSGGNNGTPVLPAEIVPGTSGQSTERTSDTTSASETGKTKATDTGLLTVPDNPGSYDLMQGISSKRELKNVDRSSVAVKLSDFAVRLFKECSENGKSTLVSPLSAILALAMTANGAKGETLSQMEKVFGMDIDTLNEALALYRESLPQDEKNKFDIANAIWFKTDPLFSVNKDFLQKNADWYDAAINAAPFNDSTLEEINSWVKDNTRGMIEKILDEISEEEIMYLVNALAFQAEWEKIYTTEDEIRDHVFITENGKATETTFMYSTEGKYLKDDKAQGFIKYYKGRKYAFVALLPDEGVKISDYVSSLTGEKLAGLLSSAEEIRVNAAIPKFKSGSTLNMNDALAAMGMPDAFNGDLADFSGLGRYEGENIYIGKVLQKTFIEVAEKGTKAAAVTSVGINYTTSIDPAYIRTVELYRPFVYMLIDCEANVPFFIGSLMDVE